MFTNAPRLLAACLIFLAASPMAAGLRAQNSTGEISGYVRDASGAVIPGVTVTLIFPDIAYSRASLTNADGYYVFPGVPNGTADLTAHLVGFQPLAKRGIRVELNARMRVDLKIGRAHV